MASKPLETAPTEEEKRKQFGNRYLEDPSKVFEHNAWDNVEWDSNQEAEACEKVKKNSSATFDLQKSEELEAAAGDNWDKFYDRHENRFFKDRNWLFTEFPELCSPSTSHLPDAKYNILEVGCGTGSTVFPIVEANSATKNVFVYCCDFSRKAVDLVKKNKAYDQDRCLAFVWDITAQSEECQQSLNVESLDVIILIFVLSAIQPNKMKMAIENLVRYLKPGGVILFRDYGRYDMAQLRFKPGKCISENFYMRGDGTRVYFFTQDEVKDLFTSCGLQEELNHVDRRLIVNRGKQLKMYRVWLQCRYKKP